jgi:3-methyladenine DNA glycosylase/8-oxoguanine DNA glycosylase
VTHRSPQLPSRALARLRRADAGLARIIDRVGAFALDPGAAEGALEALVRCVIYQQLSGAAAATIYARFRRLFSSTRFPTADEIAEQPDETLRACGLSRPKIAAIKALCERVDAGDLDPERLDELADDAIVEALSRLRGFGRWSAEMFLIFHLGRLDVWPSTDLTLRRAVGTRLGETLALDDARRGDLASLATTEAAGDRFRPYRTVAAWYLWRDAG